MASGSCPAANRGPADPLRDGVAAAVQRGQLRPDITAETFAMLTVGPLFYRRFLEGTTIDFGTVDTVLDDAMRALGLSGRPQTGVDDRSQ